MPSITESKCILKCSLEEGKTELLHRRAVSQPETPFPRKKSMARCSCAGNSDFKREAEEESCQYLCLWTLILALFDLVLCDNRGQPGNS